MSSVGSGYPLGSYRQFSGTSAAGPHVAAACALVRQKYPFATMKDVALLLTSSAATDELTGKRLQRHVGIRESSGFSTPSGSRPPWTTWRGRAPPRVLLDQNYPNPFNPSTWIPFYLPSDGLVSVKIYNVGGELVKTLRETQMPKGAHSVRWNGDDGTDGASLRVSIFAF